MSSEPLDMDGDGSRTAASTYDPNSGDGTDSGDETRRETLQRFLNSPSGFILGAVLSTLLDGFEGVLASILDGISLLFVGDAPGTEGLLGLADIPLLIGELAIGAGRQIGGTAGSGVIERSGLLGVVATLVESGLSAAELAGPLAPVVLTTEAVLVVYVLLLLFQRLVSVALDVIPGAGGLT